MGGGEMPNRHSSIIGRQLCAVVSVGEEQRELVKTGLVLCDWKAGSLLVGVCW